MTTHIISEPTTAITSDAISYRAYLLWEQAGRPEGRDLEFWLRAEKELAAGARTFPVTSDVPPPADPALVNSQSAARAVPAGLSVAHASKARRPASASRRAL